MDLLVDLVGLNESAQVQRDVDGYKVAYRTEQRLDGRAGTP